MHISCHYIYCLVGCCMSLLIHAFSCALYVVFFSKIPRKLFVPLWFDILHWVDLRCRIILFKVIFWFGSRQSNIEILHGVISSNFFQKTQDWTMNPFGKRPPLAMRQISENVLQDSGGYPPKHDYVHQDSKISLQDLTTCPGVLKNKPPNWWISNINYSYRLPTTHKEKR